MLLLLLMLLMPLLSFSLSLLLGSLFPPFFFCLLFAFLVSGRKWGKKEFLLALRKLVRLFSLLPPGNFPPLSFLLFSLFFLILRFYEAKRQVGFFVMCGIMMHGGSFLGGRIIWHKVSFRRNSPRGNVAF